MLPAAPERSDSAVGPYNQQKSNDPFVAGAVTVLVMVHWAEMDAAAMAVSHEPRRTHSCTLECWSPTCNEVE